MNPDRCTGHLFINLLMESRCPRVGTTIGVRSKTSPSADTSYSAVVCVSSTATASVTKAVPRPHLLVPSHMTGCLNQQIIKDTLHKLLMHKGNRLTIPGVRHRSPYASQQSVPSIPPRPQRDQGPFRSSWRARSRRQ